MADTLGPESIYALNPNGSTNIIESINVRITTDSVIGLDGPVGNSVIDSFTTPSLPSESLTAIMMRNFGEQFYNRIIITVFNDLGPPVIFNDAINRDTLNVGNLVQDREFFVEIYNAFFEDITLNSISETNTVGITLSGQSTPYSFNSTGFQIYNLDIDLVGPPNINAEFDFDFSLPSIDQTLSILGTRIISMPYYFSSPMTETIVWNTNILNSRNGTEQRIRVRKNPKQQFRATAKIPTNELGRVDNLLYGWRKRIWAIPSWMEARTAQSVTAGDTVITVDTRFADFREDGLALLWVNDRNFEIVEVLTFTDSQLNLAAPTANSFASPVVTPMRLARMTNNPIKQTNGYSGFLNMTLEVTDNITLETNPSADQFNSTDVYLEEPLTDGDFAQDSFVHRIEVLDYGTGGVEFFAPWTYTRINREFRLLLDSAEAIWAFREWLHRRAGRLVPFYMPTFENNLRLITTTLIGTSFEIVDDENATQASDRNHIAVQKTDGTWEFRTITSITLNPSNNVDVVIDQALNLLPSEIEFISYMGLKRLNSDRIEITHLQDCKAEVIVPIIELEP